MALLTLGTKTTTALNAFVFTRNPQHLADVAALRAGILNDQTTGPNGLGAIWPDAFDQGVLYIPNRGVLKLIPGDVIAFDTATGWPTLVSALAISSGSTVWDLS